MILRPISISLSPNTQKDDISLSFKLIFQPRKWKKGGEIEELENEFKKYLGVNPVRGQQGVLEAQREQTSNGVKHAISFNSGRSSFLAILKSLDLKEDDEVLLQAFTCNALVNPILWANLKPVYVDCQEDTLNIDPEDLKRKITKRSRAVVVQHTFGLPADLDEILEVCQKNNLILIEDCAHSLGAEYYNKKIGLPAEARRAKVGTFGRVAFFSFGRDKIISSVYGGMAVTNDEVLAQKIRSFQEKCDFPSNFWIFQQLLHPVLINYLILPLYGFFEIGRLFLLFFQKIKILSKSVSNQEKKGKNPSYFPKRLPDAMAILALNQFKKLQKVISHQREICQFYDEELKEKNFLLPPKDPERIYMRYPVLIKDCHTDDILKKARKLKIFLDDGWRKAPITPPDTDQAAMEYISGSCPVAEKIAETILNLPTHINISQKEAEKITNFLKKLL